MSKKQNFFITIGNEQIPVTQEVYKAYYKAGRRMRYVEHDIKYGKTIKDKNGNEYFIPAKEDSLEQLSEIGKAPYTEDTYSSDNTYDASAFLILSKALEILSEDEKSIIHDLYSKNKSARTVAAEKGVSHTAINKRNKSILKKIKTFFEKEGFHFG